MPLSRRQATWLELPTIADRFPSITQAVKWLQSQDIGYHFQTMWRDVSSAFQTFNKRPLQMAYTAFDRIPQNLFIEKDYRNPKPYRYYGDAIYKDKVTGELYAKDYTIYADTSLSDSELTELVYAREEERLDPYDDAWVLSSFESIDRVHKWGAPRSEGYGIAEI